MRQTDSKPPATVSVTIQSGGERLDQYLGRIEEVGSRSAGHKLIDAGAVTINGKRVKKASLIIRAGDKLHVKLPVASVPSPILTDINLPILYEDDACMVINKPAGMIVHAGHGTRDGEATMLDVLKSLFAERSLPYSESSILAHRLDKDTTGCLLVAKTPAAHRKLQKQFAERNVSKTYLALVEGVPSPAAAVIDAPIGRHVTERTKMSVLRTAKGREAKTTYRVLSKTKEYSLLSVDIHTGRTHQIRVHLAAIGHPLIGDATYGTPISQRLSQILKTDTVVLHAWKLSFSSGRKKVHVEAPIPSPFAALIKKVELELPDAE